MTCCRHFSHMPGMASTATERPVADGGQFGDPSSAQGLSGLLRAGWWWGTVPGGRLRDCRGQARALVPTADGASEIVRCGLLPLVSGGHGRAAVDRSSGARNAERSLAATSSRRDYPRRSPLLLPRGWGRRRVAGGLLAGSGASGYRRQVLPR